MSSPTQPAAPAGPVVSRTEVTWRGERLFDAGPPGRTHRIDASAKQAPGPVETLLNAIATCSAVDVVDIMNKRKTPIERMTIHVTAERRSEPPRRIQHLEIEFRVDGTGLEREQVERAIHLSFERYCSVASSLAPDIVAEARLTLNGETFPSVRQQIWTAHP
jgi:putative redox protein